MGGKSIGQWQQICICLAVLIIVSGCGLFQESSNRRRELREALTQGHQLLARGDYDGSLKAFQNVIVIAKDQPPADAAIFYMGVVHAHPQNPGKDRRKAVDSFDHVLMRYPDSPFVEPAKAWIGALNEIDAAREEIERTKLEVEKSKQEIENSRLTADRSKQEAEKSRVELERSRQEIEKIKQEIEKSKQVDIQIEKKRRERGR